MSGRSSNIASVYPFFPLKAQPQVWKVNFDKSFKKFKKTVKNFTFPRAIKFLCQNNLGVIGYAKVCILLTKIKEYRKKSSRKAQKSKR